MVAVDRPALLDGATRVGNFDERQWGISASAVSIRDQRSETSDDIQVSKKYCLLGGTQDEGVGVGFRR